MISPLSSSVNLSSFLGSCFDFDMVRDVLLWRFIEYNFVAAAAAAVVVVVVLVLVLARHASRWHIPLVCGEIGPFVLHLRRQRH